MDKSREDFEAWWAREDEATRSNGLGLISRARRKQKALEAWQASRKALVVDIDSHTEFEIEHIASPKEDGYSKGWIDGRNYAARQFVAAGITVKGEGDEQTNVLSPE